jgi:hypothetical protein
MGRSWRSLVFKTGALQADCLFFQSLTGGGAFFCTPSGCLSGCGFIATRESPPAQTPPTHARTPPLRGGRKHRGGRERERGGEKRATPTRLCSFIGRGGRGRTLCQHPSPLNSIIALFFAHLSYDDDAFGYLTLIPKPSMLDSPELWLCTASSPGPH